jgi:hypothetical protein
MSDIDPRILAQQRLASRRHRFRGIRKRVAAGAAAVFIAVFGGLTIQLAAGGDPGLASSGSGQANAAVVSNTAAAASSATQSSSSSSDARATPSPVTTAQS